MKFMLLLVVLILITAVSGIYIYYKKYPSVAEPTAMQLQLAERMRGEVFTDSANKYSLPYRLYEPHGRAEGRKFPLVVVLQASGGRGEENVRQLSESVDRLLSEELQHIEPAYVLAPQCPAGLEWNNAEPSSPPYVNYSMEKMSVSWRQTILIELINFLLKNKQIDETRIYLTGMSMGGTGAWDTLYRFPGYFSAAVILNGRSDPAAAGLIGRTPIWSFHGVDDPVAPIENSQKMVAALQAENAIIKFTELNAGHGIAYQSYTPDVYRWMMSFKK